MAEQKSECRTVDDVLGAMRASFRPDACRDLTAIVHWKLSGPNGREFTVRVDRGNFDVQQGSVEKADLVMETSAENYVRLANRQLSGIVAIMTRKLRVRGNVQLAARWDRIFG